MPTTTIAGHAVEVNDEGFLTRPDQWSDDLGTELARLIGIELTDGHWKLGLVLLRLYTTSAAESLREFEKDQELASNQASPTCAGSWPLDRPSRRGTRSRTSSRDSTCTPSGTGMPLTGDPAVTTWVTA